MELIPHNDIKDHIRCLVSSFFAFVRDPDSPDYEIMSTSRKLTDVGVYYLFLSFVPCLCIALFIIFLQHVHLMNPLNYINEDSGWLRRILGVLILAPILEEGLFRYFLGPLRRTLLFKWLYYSSSLIFGLMHFFNFQPDTDHYIFIILITMPQTFLGFILGYIRIIYGFWFAVMFHFLYNSLFVGLSFIFD